MDGPDIIIVTRRDSLCRLCARQDVLGVIDIFGKEGKRKQLAENIHLCAGITISEFEDLPRVICGICQNSLKRCLQFRDTCFQADRDIKRSRIVYLDDDTGGKSEHQNGVPYINTEEAISELHTAPSVKHKTRIDKSKHVQVAGQPGRTIVIKKKKKDAVQEPSKEVPSFRLICSRPVSNRADFVRQDISGNKRITVGDGDGITRLDDDDSTLIIVENNQVDGVQNSLIGVNYHKNNSVVTKGIDHDKNVIEDANMTSPDDITEDNGDVVQIHKKIVVDGLNNSDKIDSDKDIGVFKVRAIKRFKPPDEDATLCHVCAMEFPTTLQLKRHTASHQREEIKKSLSRELSYDCDECGRKYVSQWGLKVHRQIHMKPHPCTKCQKVYGRECDLREHVARVHDKSMELKCPKCGIIKYTRRQLQSHFRSHFVDQNRPAPLP